MDTSRPRDKHKQSFPANDKDLYKAVVDGNRTLLLRWIDNLTEEVSTLFCQEKRGKLLRAASQYSVNMTWDILSTGKFSGNYIAS